MYGTDIGLLNDMASKAQSNGVGAVVNYEFEGNGFEVRAMGKTPEEWQQCRRACEQMQRAAGASIVNAEVIVSAEGNVDAAARTMIHDLDNSHQVQLDVDFRQPDA